ncbi:hypothetical protein U9M48_014110, partial [Paspalum notatum var. saurae]
MTLSLVIWKLFIASCGILRVAQEMDFYIPSKEIYKLSVMLMLIGLVLWMMDAQLLDIAPLLVVIWSHGEERNKVLWLGPLQKLSSVQWLMVYILLTELRLFRSKPLMLYCDNKAAIDIANNLVQHDRTKHVEIDRHFIKEKLEEGIICLPYVNSASQVAYVLTKGLPEKTFSSFLARW